MPSCQLIQTVVADLPSPSPAVIVEAHLVDLTTDEHHRLAAEVPAFGEIEQHAADDMPPLPLLHVAAWNAERLKFHGPSVKLVEQIDADVLFLTEADLGMARSGNRHTTADLAEALGMGYAYGVEFLELGLGDDRERAAHARETNATGFHGNAVLTRMPLEDPFLVRLDDGAVWWLEAEKGQQRLGWRMAIGGRVMLAGGPVWVVSVHLESKTTPADRALQVKRLLQHVDALSEGGAVVVGGDFNTKLLKGDEVADWIADPAVREPLFAHMRDAGFTWDAANTRENTTRTRPDGNPKPPHQRLDWLFTRGLVASHPMTVAAIDDNGDAISDHDLVAVDVQLI
jgi:endonuclease/exonuclease/phosphatase family metal-dependent hydrolase